MQGYTWTYGLAACVRNLEGERLGDQGQCGLDGSRAMGMNFVLHVHDHKRISIKKETQNNKVVE